MKRALEGLALAVTVVAMGLANPASAGQSSVLSNKVAREPTGPYKQFLDVHIGAGKAKTFYEKIKNGTDEDQSVVLTRSTEPNPQFTIKAVRGTEDVSDDIVGAGYDFILAGEENAKLRIKVKRAAGPADPLCLGLRAEDEAHDLAVAGIAVNTTVDACLTPVP